jgi:hypothetical protein
MCTPKCSCTYLFVYIFMYIYNFYITYYIKSPNYTHRVSVRLPVYDHFIF